MGSGDRIVRLIAILAGLACASATIVGGHALARVDAGIRSAAEADPFFAGNWLVSEPLGPAEDRRAAQVAVDSRGRVIIGSHARDKGMSWTCDSNRDAADQRRNPHTTSAHVAYLERYLPNGLLDRDFGDDGVAEIPQFAHNQGLRSIGALPDGSVVVLLEGETAGCLPERRVGRDIALRINSDGQWDRNWAPRGRMLTDIFGVFALAVDSDRVVLAGDAILHWWQAGEWSSAALPHRTTTQSLAMSPGWIAVNDVNQEVDSEGAPVLTRTANGWLIRNDTEMSPVVSPVRFRIPLDLPGSHMPGRSLLSWDAQGRLIAVTSVYELASAPPEGWMAIEDTYVVVSRVLVDDEGATRLDPAFGDAGRFTFRPDPVTRPQRYVHAVQMATMPDGGVLLLGVGPVPGYGHVNLALRLTVDGRRDMSFGTAGIAPLPNEAIMEGPAAVDRLGRWFGAATDSLTSRGKKVRSATVRMSQTGALAVSNGSGWRPIAMPPKKPARLQILSLLGCEATGPRTVSAVVRVTGRSGAHWRPLRGATVDMTEDDANGNTNVLIRKNADRRGLVQLEASVTGSGPIGFYFGFSNTHLEVFRVLACGGA